MTEGRFIKYKLHFYFKKVSFLLLIGSSLLFLASFLKPDPNIEIEKNCRQFVLNNISFIKDKLKTSTAVITSTLSNEEKINTLKNEYRLVRKLYKEIEFFIEYNSAYEAKYFINGPLVPKFELEYLGTITDPHGFQVIEENIFNQLKTNFDVLQKEYKLLDSKFFYLQNYYGTLPIENSKLTEALRLQIIRIMCLTLNGYDCTINKESLTECAHSINGIATIMNFYKGKKIENIKLNELLNHLKQCEIELKKNPDSDSFNRLNFTTKFLNPAYTLMSDFFSERKVSPSEINYGVDFNTHSFFETSALNKQHFLLYKNDTANLNSKAELGKILFFDPILSSNNKRACASCHSPNKAFTDGLPKSLSLDGKGNITRNAPTLLNALYQKVFFYDGRVASLEGQVNHVLHNNLEMGILEADVINKLNKSEEYKNLFKNAFKETSDTNITFYFVLKCIAEFEMTLISRNSKFDKYLKGNDTILSRSEINGYNLFSGKALCGSCHFFPLFNGTVPPMYNENEYEVIGVPANMDNKTIDDDIGRQKFSHVAIHNKAFKTPTLRNISLTAPYMHNGVYSNLDQVLDFYNAGGGAGLKLKIENQTLPFDSLKLSKNELSDIKNFLLVLTDTSNIPKPPKSLPKFKDNALNNRKIGGEY
jgi:cytochrome c peroxidase